MSVRDDIEEANRTLGKALANGDTARIASLYTQDAVLLPMGAPRMDGRAAIEAFFKQGLEGGFNDLTLETQDVTDAGDLAIEIGRWTSSAMGGDAGKYVVVWKKEAEGPKLQIDIFNSDTPPPTA